jgi:hypothetical protein
MPYGFFTVEQWKRPSPRSAPQWTAIKHLDACNTLSSVMGTIAADGKPGFFRVVQTQRMIKAEKVNGKLRLRKWHAGSPETLARSAESIDSDGGAWIAAARRRKQ